VGSQRARGPRVGIHVDPAALKQARVDAGLSLAQVAGSDMTRQAVHLIETGRVRPTLRSLRIIAQRLGVHESALLAPPGPMSDEQAVAELRQLCERHELTAAAERARHLIAHCGSPERIAYAHHYAAYARYLLGEPSEALAHAREARERFAALRNPWWEAESMDWEAIVLNMLQDSSALQVARRALRRYRALEPRWPETEARMLGHLGTICFGRRDYGAAREAYEAALHVDGGVRELATMARIYHGLGMCHNGLGDPRTAADLVFKAVTLYEAEQRIAAAPMRQEQPRAENDLGLVVMALGDLDRAEGLFRAALEHFAAAGIERLQSHILLSLGELRQRQDRLDDALGFVTRAIERAAAFDETYALTSGYRQLGELYEVRCEHGLADASFHRALVLCDAAGLEERAKEYMHAYERVLAERRVARRRARDVSASA
jgi:tetratricopeptide (TPR) repeat protein